jgi:hypothetical protein
MPWVLDDADRRLLLARHAAYTDLVARAAAAVLPRGRALMVHTYAPRTVDVAVDDRIVASLHDAYRPEVVERWPLRAPVDLITQTPDGAFLADAGLVARARAGLASLGIAVAENEAYGLHPSTSAAALARGSRARRSASRCGATSCGASPFLEMTTDPDAVDRLAAPFAAALAR